MTAKTIRPSEVTELLPSRKSYKPGACFRWHTASRILTTTTDLKTEQRYWLTEYPVDDVDSRDFVLQKLDDGTDPESDSYTVFLADAQGFDSCDCRGQLRWGHCKHVDAVRAILANGWLITDAEQAAEAPVSTFPTDDEINSMGDLFESEHSEEALTPVETPTMHDDDPATLPQGATLRDLFAAHALAGYLAAHADPEVYVPKPVDAADMAYRYADAMLARRSKP